MLLITRKTQLTLNRSRLYNKPDTKTEIEEINKKLRKLRKELRTCNNIFQDVERIQEHQKYVAQLEQQAENKQQKQFTYKERWL